MANGQITDVKLAFTGKMRSGKSTLQGYAILYYGYQPFAFGDPLKEHAHRLFPWIPRTPKPRRLYQAYGQAMRNLDVEGAEDVWVTHTFDKIARYGGDRVLITDARQPNEIARLKAEGYVIIRVNASDNVRMERAKQAGDSFTAEDLAHETEALIDTYDVDYEINNDGDIVNATEQFDAIMADLGVEETEVAQ